VVLASLVYVGFKSNIFFEERGMIEQIILLILTGLVYVGFKSNICFEVWG